MPINKSHQKALLRPSTQLRFAQGFGGQAKESIFQKYFNRLKYLEQLQKKLIDGFYKKNYERKIKSITKKTNVGVNHA